MGSSLMFILHVSVVGWGNKLYSYQSCTSYSHSYSQTWQHHDHPLGMQLFPGSELPTLAQSCHPQSQAQSGIWTAAQHLENQHYLIESIRQIFIFMYTSVCKASFRREGRWDVKWSPNKFQGHSTAVDDASADMTRIATVLSRKS